MSGVPQFMEGDPLDNAERLLAGALEGHLPADEEWWHFTRGEVADLEVALAELRRAREMVVEAIARLRAVR